MCYFSDDKKKEYYMNRRYHKKIISRNNYLNKSIFQLLTKINNLSNFQIRKY